jgi:hypothetical protein
MQRTIKYVGLGVGFFALSVVMGSGVRRAAANPPPADVNVINTPTVNIGTMPAVSVSLPSGSLSVSGDVGLNAGSTIQADPSQLVALQAEPSTPNVYGGAKISSKNALVVLNANDGQRPFTIANALEVVGPSTSGIEVAGTVPAGKRAVVESISASISVPTGMQVVDAGVIVVGTDPSGQFNQPGGMYLVLTKTATNVDGADIYTGSTTARMYSEPGTSMQAFMDVGPGSGTSVPLMNYLINGYLVDAP